MKIKELIKKLREFDEGTDVFIEANQREEAEYIMDNTFANDSITIY